MDPRRNPFAPGAGTQPPELAGRDQLVENASIALDRIRNGKQARSFIYYGLRGVGKTVLLNRIMADANSAGFATAIMEASEGRSLPAQLAPHLRALFLRLSLTGRAKQAFERSLKVLAGFISAVKVTFNDVEVGIDAEPIVGLADSGDLEHDLRDLMQTAGEAAKQSDTPIVIFIDELQYIDEKELAAFITALHYCGQQQLPITLVAAGLPPLLGQMGKAKSYAERLFEFTEIGNLSTLDVYSALSRPIEKEGAKIDEDAKREIAAQTQGYPYFVQEWGKHSWNVAQHNYIGYDDVLNASIYAFPELDAGFYRVRFDRCTPAEKDYLFAMAALGGNSHRSGAIAEQLKRPASAVAQIRNSLIKKGMIYSPSYGDTAFTVPMFDGFLKRIRQGR